MISQTKNIAIFASGNGSNAIELIKHAKKLNFTIACLICDNPHAGILKKEIPIPIHLIEKTKSKKEHEREILKTLERYQVNWIFLAGYMRILSEDFIAKFTHKHPTHAHSRIINIHPSLLPKYQGLHAYERSFANNDQFGGITIHYVDAGIDTGEMILQGKFERKNEDTITDYIKRGQELEHGLYPKILERVIKYDY